MSKHLSYIMPKLDLLDKQYEEPFEEAARLVGDLDNLQRILEKVGV